MFPIQSPFAVKKSNFYAATGNQSLLSANSRTYKLSLAVPTANSERVVNYIDIANILSECSDVTGAMLDFPKSAAGAAASPLYFLLQVVRYVGGTGHREMERR